MPRRTDIRSILLIGSGPIVIGQACEFDYSGTQACKDLKEEGYRVILINSNPATIMTDPDFADRTYIEPITLDVVEKVIECERPDALLPTMGGQTALNTAIGLAKRGVLEKYGVRLIGASIAAIHKAEDRDAFRQAMWKIGLRVPDSGVATSLAEAERELERIRFPAIVRPSFTMGGTGGNIAYNIEEFRTQVEWGLSMSPVRQVLIEQSVIGWKEFELEVMRDLKDNVVIICPIENLDPMGVHTGDSITVAPALTLTDKEYQMLRDAAVRIIREIGVDTGGANIQFGLNPVNGEMVVIEMNPRVSRSSALASKATGFPIAKIAAKLAVGYTLDEITNDITGVTKASFERRRQDSTLCLSEIPRSRSHVDHTDEVGGRSDGHRTHLQGIAAESDPVHGSRSIRIQLEDGAGSRGAARPRPGRGHGAGPQVGAHSDTRPAVVAGRRHAPRHAQSGIIRAHQDRPLVSGADS